MRHYKILSIVVLSFLILFIACSKSDDDSATSGITFNQLCEDAIKAKLDEIDSE